MATSKTLTPTNVTIQIPEFTDQPDQRVNSNCLDKEADAINALDTNAIKISNRITGWMAEGETLNLDNMHTNGSCGIWWCNVGATDVTGTKPVSSGQGILIVLKQSASVYRQTYIGITSNQKMWNRYYNTNNETWSAWTEYWTNA